MATTKFSSGATMRSLALLALLGSRAVEAAPAGSTLPIIDLGYSLNQATINATGAYYNFSNIAYAEPPLGELRFAAPIPPQSQNRTVNDGQNTRICPQASPAWELTAEKFLTGTSVATLLAEQANTTLSLSDIPKPGPRENEDCLLLDVIVPEAIYNHPSAQYQRGEGDAVCSDSGGAPVLVWIYGGGYTGGNKGGNGNPAGLIAASQADGSDGVVFVAMNYRLGLFGWMSGPTFQANGTANVGLYDQRLALEWIQQNIHLFGGDPNRVTVMGESAGGGSIMHQITAYGGLKGPVPFQQAIPQSPAFANVPTAYEQEQTYQKVLTYASALSGETITTTEQLRGLSTTTLQLINAVAVGLAEYGTFTFGPAVDGNFVPALPGQLLLHGQFDKSLKLMVGHNLNEGIIFTSPFIQNETQFVDWFVAQAPGVSDDVIDYVENVLYPPVYNGTYGYSSIFFRAALLIAESSFTCTTRYLDEAYNGESYAYYFTIPPGLHGQDTPFTFFNGDTSTIDDLSPVNATIAKTFQRYLTTFAKTGNPNFEGGAYFPQYGANSTVLEIDTSDNGMLAKDSVANDRCTWWQKGLY